MTKRNILQWKIFRHGNCNSGWSFESDTATQLCRIGSRNTIKIKRYYFRRVIFFSRNYSLGYRSNYLKKKWCRYTYLNRSWWMILKSSKRFYFAKRRTCLWTRVILFGFFPYSFSKTKDFLPAFINVQAFYVHLPILDLNKKNMLMKQLVLHYYIMK